MRGSVTLHVDAPPEKVWALVSDVTKIGRFSPETFEAEWADGATGPAAGAKFRGHVRRTSLPWFPYWTDCTVRACEPNRVFTFSVDMRGRPVNTWSYQLEPTADGGTDVTESYELADGGPMRMYWKLFGKGRARTNEEGMRKTLERVKQAAEE